MKTNIRQSVSGLLLNRQILVQAVGKRGIIVRRRSIIGSCWAAIVCLSACKSSPPQYPSIQITRVISGQSVEWVDRSTQPPLIEQGRLIGIDAPALAQEPWGKQAKQRLEELIGIPGKNHVSVEFESTEPDKFGRKFVYLWQDGRLLNEQLIRDGVVFASITNPNITNPHANSSKYRDRFSRGSQYARLMGQGIWNPEQPLRMSPSEFRQEER